MKFHAEFGILSIDIPYMNLYIIHLRNSGNLVSFQI